MRTTIPTFTATARRQQACVRAAAGWQVPQPDAAGPRGAAARGDVASGGF
jgi:hypothetical protein